MITKPNIDRRNKPVAPAPVVAVTPPTITWELLVSTINRMNGWNEEQVKTYLTDICKTPWSPENYWEIVITLRLQLIRAQSHLSDPVGTMDRYYELCPVCGVATVPDPRRDHKFGAAYGWLCPANPFHFMEWRFAGLKAWFTRNQEDK